ncbi:Chromatin accessibility complex 14kD protein [Carabus blaptoides fortunei]
MFVLITQQSAVILTTVVSLCYVNNGRETRRFKSAKCCSRTALGRAASVFVLYVTSAATNVSKKANRKTVTGQDVLDAMSELEFEEFVEPLNEQLQAFRKSKKEAAGKGKQKKITDVNSLTMAREKQSNQIENQSYPSFVSAKSTNLSCEIK